MILALSTFAVLAVFVLLGVLLDRRRAQANDSELASLGRAAVWVAVIVIGLGVTLVVIALGSMMFGHGRLM